MKKKLVSYSIIIGLIFLLLSPTASADPVIQLSDNLASIEQNWLPYDNHMSIDESLDQPNGVTFYGVLERGLTNSSADRTGVVIYHGERRTFYESGSVYILEGTIEINGEPIKEEELELVWNGENGYFDHRPESEILESYYNDSTGYLREVYYIKSDRWLPISMMTQSSINMNEKQLKVFEDYIGQSVRLNGFQAREVLNAEELGWIV